MFKSSTSYILGAVAILASAAVVSASPTTLEARNVNASPTISVCTGFANPATGCVTIPVLSDTCINFTGGLSFLNKEVSGAVVPDGFVCTFFANYGCLVAQNAVDVVLTGGTYNFFSIQGPSGIVNFNDQPSSFSCSPV